MAGPRDIPSPTYAKAAKDAASSESVQADTEPSLPPNKQPSRVSFGLIQFIIGLAVGAAISWAFLFATLDTASPFVDATVQVLLPVLGVLALLLAAALPLTIWAVRRFFIRTQGTIEQVVHEASTAV